MAQGWDTALRQGMPKQTLPDRDHAMGLEKLYGEGQR
jgi:hypothetical protein